MMAYIKMISDRVAKVGKTKVVLYGMLIFISILYVLGLFAQLFSKKVQSGKEPLTINPFKIIYLYFTDGIMISIVLFTIMILIIVGLAFFVYKRRFQASDEDGRFKSTDTGTYGNAHLLRKEDIKTYGDIDVGRLENVHGIILGRFDEYHYVSYHPKDISDNRNMMLVGSAGSRKTRGGIIPNVYKMIQRGESIILFDTKGTNYAKTIKAAIENDYITRVYNLKNYEVSDGWACLKDIGTNIELAQQFSDVIIVNTKTPEEKASAKFWSDGERNLLTFLILYVNQEYKERQAMLPKEKIKREAAIEKDPDWNPINGYGTIGRVYDMLLSGYSGIAEKASQIMANNNERDFMNQHPGTQAWNAYNTNEKKEVLSGVISSLLGRLRLLQVPAVRNMLGQDDIDLTLPSKKKCIYYISADDQDRGKDFLLALFASMFFIRVIAEADKNPSEKMAIGVNMIFDEFKNMGIIPDFDNKISTVRSRGLSITICLQSMQQLESMYPDDWQTIVGNCIIQVCMKAGDEQTADYFEWMAGRATAEQRGTMINKESLLPDSMQFIPQFRETKGEAQRQLLYSDEIRRMDKNEMLCFIDSLNALKLEKFDLTDMEMGKNCEEYNITRHPENMRIIMVNKKSDKFETFNANGISQRTEELEMRNSDEMAENAKACEHLNTLFGFNEEDIIE
ncbi:VirD4-like conjugal transfer protein, CD1115 family [Eubacterium limosum]|uniref:VirD4-like conjugal transfer protein, CD1115 family n=1 Tax=Eubacterium limosum TaxID=1736 RepID=UPI00371F5D4D